MMIGAVIKVCDGLYEVYSDGRIWSVKKGRFLCNPKYGYHRVAIKKNGKMSTIGVHRIIAEAFIPNPDGKPCINHKNGIKSDNRVDNLEWVTYSENCAHAYKTGLKIAIPGKGSPMFGKKGKDANKSLPVNKIHPITNHVIETYDSVSQAAKEHGICVSAISNCFSGRATLSAGFKWAKIK